MKSPDHPTPSGDRRMARLIGQALRKGGHKVDLASEFRSFNKTGNLQLQSEIEETGHQEAQRLIKSFRTMPEKGWPDVWFTYHVYHKAPDYLGPVVSKALGIPYLIAEASHAPKRKTGLWASGYAAAEAAIGQADRVFHMTRLDGECLKPVVSSKEKLVYLPPFLDELPQSPEMGLLEKESIIAGLKPDCLTLLTVAMMRSGDKLNSYRQLAEALSYLPKEGWQLVIVGDGEKRADIEQMFRSFEDNVLWMGERPQEDLYALYRLADLYVWPASGEAYGMVFLEAGACGLPSVAGRIRGVPDVVLDGRTGLLSPENDMQAFAELIRKLINDPELRTQFGDNAQIFVREERSLEKAASLLDTHIKACRS